MNPDSLNSFQILPQIPEISIIMPVFNGEDYLRNALESIEKQTFKNWECIIVDDGSTDNTAKIYSGFTGKDSRFKSIKTENRGVAAARNRGIEAAKGKYICFVDADDWVEKEYLSTLFDLIVKNDVEIVQCGFIREFTDKGKPRKTVKENSLISRDEALSDLLKNKYLTTTLWNKIYKREVVSGNFPDGITYEDAYLLPSWISETNRILVTPHLLYHYRMRKSGITKSGNSKNYYDYFQSCRHLALLVKDKLGVKAKDEDVNRYIAICSINSGKNIARNEKDKKTRSHYLKEISEAIQDVEFRSSKTLGVREKIRLNFLKKNIPVFVLLLKLQGALDFSGGRKRHHYFN